MRQLLFSIERLAFQGGGKTLVAGRCCRDPIKDGDVAQFMVYCKEDGSFSKPEAVSVVFHGFELYGKKVDAIESGYTAGILVPDKSATGLRLGWFLKGQNA